jgi:tetratricopeptide (TPR) repeat protein
LDFLTSRDLLGRAETLLPERSPKRLDLLPNLGVALTETGRPGETEALLSKAVADAREAGSERDALRALIQLQANRVYRSPTDAEIEAALRDTRFAADALQAMGDDVGLAEAAIAMEYLEFLRGRAAEAHAWTFRALEHGFASGRPREATQGAADLVGYAVMGPLPFDRFHATAASIPGPDGSPIRASTSLALMAVAALATGDDAGFRELEARWRDVIDRHGLSWLGATHAIQIGLVETSAGRPIEGELRLREARDTLAAFGDIWWVDTIDCYLCLALSAQDRTRDFLRLAEALDSVVTIPDPGALILRSVARSRTHLLRGSAADAEAAARRAVELADATDLLPYSAEALLALADVLIARGRADEATHVRGKAVDLLRAKGNLSAARVAGG